MRSEDYFENPLLALRRVVRHLNLPQLSAEELRRADRKRSHDELQAVLSEHGMPSSIQLEGVRTFYAPFNAELARMLHDRSFLWVSQSVESG